MLYPVLKSLHLLSVVFWLGGMAFAYFILRPAVARLEPAARLALMHDVLGRFLTAVLVLAVLALGTGSWLIGQVARQVVQAGAPFIMPVEWMIMSGLGFAMALIFVYIRWVLYARFGRAVLAAQRDTAARALATLSRWVLANLLLGVVIVLVTLVGVTR